MLSDFATVRAKQAVAAAIRDVEAQTSAEVVVAVRPWAGSYRQADYLTGFLASFATLLVLLFHPVEFNVALMPIDVLCAFILGSVASAYVTPLRRLFSSRRQMRKNVATAARAAFVDLGVSRTRGRSGILVFVAAFERAVEIVADVGIDSAVLGAPFRDAGGALERALRSRGGHDRFIAALLALGPTLGRALPRSADDVNELPDEVQ